MGPKKPTQPPPKPADEDDDFDRLIAEAQFGVSKCGVSGCKNSLMIAHSCKFCHLNYCTQHRLSEEHGCGGDAKKDARQQHKTKMTTMATGNLKEHQREHLERKLKESTSRTKPKPAK
eukprot:comp92853_c0_seq1/m.48618 comp92853_c0_seq1/g.48618  ORF comp92853_c0_seq1/g.48618 comp92853_c0_seq1/m.48618 type:complete len:118 (-) comp92853_c0_seq1:54-407(-)